MLQPRHEIEYPCSDGLPMSDSEPAYRAMVNTHHALEQWFKDDPKVYVAANMLVYYKIGHPEERVAPDVFVAKGAVKRVHDTYKIWEEGVPPTVAFEFMSRSSRHLDPKVKVPLYRELGVAECYLFDPVGKWLKAPRFKAFHARGKGWQEQDVSGGRIFSPALGLEIRVEGNELRFYDPKTGRRLTTPGEETQRADNEAKIARAEKQRADAEAQRADAEAQRADAEAQRVRELQAELEKLRRQLEER